MQIQDTLRQVVAEAMDKKAQHPVVLDIRGLSVIADYFVICSGNSEIQVKSIVQAIKDKAQEIGISDGSTEGLDDSRWVLIDLGDIIVHVFHREEREYYNLEKLWSDAAQIEVLQA